MKKIIFLTIISCFKLAYSQSTFQKLYFTRNSLYPPCITRSYDGNYMISGTMYIESQTFTDVLIIKTSPEGNIIWSRTYGGPYNDASNYIQSTHDSGYIIIGGPDSFTAGSYIIRIDSIGDILWTKSFSAGFMGYAIKETFDEGFIFNLAGGVLCKSDKNGDTLWSKSYSFDPYSVEQCADSGFIISGSVPFTANHVVVKTNQLGDTLWSYTFYSAINSERNFARQCADGGYLISGAVQNLNGGSDKDIYLLKLSSSGQVTWAKTYGNVGNDYANTFIQTSDGGFLLLASTFSFTLHRDIYLIKTDSIGNLQWTKRFGENFQDIPGQNIFQSDDGGLVFPFTTTLDTNTWIALIKTDSLGRSGCTEYDDSCIVTSWSPNVQSVLLNISNGISGVISSTQSNIFDVDVLDSTRCSNIGIVELDELQLKLSPNPFHDKIQISCSAVYNHSIFAIEVYNLLGENIYSEIHTKSQLPIEIDLTNPPPGIYVVKIQTDEGVFSEKVIKE